MKCPACRHDNRTGAKFCEECAAPLKHVCAACGSELRPTAKFCDECGAATTAQPQPSASARKVVTIVFGDLVGSTSLHERLDPESVGQFMERYYAAMRGAVEAHGGTVTQLLGDGVKAVFGAPRVAEDDAIRAVRAAVAMQRTFRELAAQQSDRVGTTGLRVAVNTGEVVADEATEIIGDPVNVAARLQEQGRDGDVVIGGTTERLVATLVTLERLGSFALKGRSEAVTAYRVVSLERPVGATAAPFVGREVELARLEAVHAAAVTTPATRLVVLLGSPGLGKSRLIDELARRHAEAATILAAHCDAAGGATFAPLAQALRGLLGLDDGAVGAPVRAAVAAALPAGDESECARIAAGVDGLISGAPTSPEETFFVVRRFLAALASVKPVILVIDDLHWAEPLLLDLVEHLVQWGGGVPLFVLVGARPELRGLRSSLVTPGGLVADVVTLGGLDAGAAMRLAASVIGAPDLPAAVAAKVLATSEGNPLFVGELVRMLVQEGALTRDGERWTAGAGLAALEMPPTIHALLAARIERLRPEERAVLERAAVVGRHFSRSAVAALMPRDGGDLDARLESLRRSELIERDAGWLLGEPALRFHHVLIRDAAYRRLLKGTRAELHARLADWIEAQVADAPEHDETIGWHLEQAHQHLRELGPIDPTGAALGERAAKRLAAAGRRALARDDVPLAASLLGRAVDRLTPDAPERADLVLDWCEALLSAGDVGPAAAAIAELDRLGADSDRLRAWHTCFAGQLTVLTAPEGLRATADRVGAAARDLAAQGDAAGEAKAHFVHAQALARLGKVGACEAALDQALAAARRAGDRRRANAVLAGAPLAALWGPSPVTRASGRCLDVVRVLRITQGAPAVEAVALSCQGVLEALRGRTDAARRMMASSRKMVEELGITHRVLETDVFAGRIDLLEGDTAAAERGLRRAYDGLRELGLGIDAARAAALLARALLAQGKAAEAEVLSRESEALAGDDLQAAIAWRGARAEALAERGEHEAAVELAQAAVAIAAATDALLDHADARLALAAALRAAGRIGEAEAEMLRATELWEAKGATFLAGRTRRDERTAVPAAAGLFHHVEPFPAEQDQEAVCRFDELAAASAPARAARRCVRANAATKCGELLQAAIESRNADAFAAQLAEPLEFVHHPTRTTFGRSGTVVTWRSVLRAEHLTYRRELLATLGNSLALDRQLINVEGLAEKHLSSVGAVEVEEILLTEVDGHGRVSRFEVFAADRVGDAIARLYERYAECLPNGSRARAVTAAHSIAAMLEAPDVHHLAAGFAADIELIDHRTLATWSARGAAAALEHFRGLLEVGESIAMREHEILDLRHDALAVRRTHCGTDRVSGGAYERRFILILLCGPDGRLVRIEWLEADREAEALARFDALDPKGRVPAPTPPRRLRPNAASILAARFQSAFAAGDDAAIADMFATALEVVDHPNGATYGRDGHLASVRRLRRARDPVLRFEPIATLGEGLLLARRHITASGTGSDRFDVGEYERDEIILFGVEENRFRHVDIFAADHLTNAVVCLYERYAATLPPGPARERAAVTARSIGSMFFDLVDRDRLANPFSPAVEWVDHRVAGVGVLRGDTAVLAAVGAFLDLARDVRWRNDEVIACSADALLDRATNSGVDRAGGGAFERTIHSLVVFGADGLIERWETFESTHEAEAIARFDALVGRDGAATLVSSASRFANSAARMTDAISGYFEAHDWPRFTQRFSEGFRYLDRRRMALLDLDRDQYVAFAREMADGRSIRGRNEILATRGERLALARYRVDVTDDDVGPSELEFVNVTEVDERGLGIAFVRFDIDDLDAAHAELDARYEAGEGMAHRGHRPIMRPFSEAVASRDGEQALSRPFSNAATRFNERLTRAWAARDWDAVAMLHTAALQTDDRRRLLQLRVPAEPSMVQLRVLFDVPGSRWVITPIATRGERLALSRILFEGEVEGGGGALAIDYLAIDEVDADGGSVAVILFDPDDLDAAYAELDARWAAGDAATRPLESRWLTEYRRFFAARDWEGMAALMAPDLVSRSHRLVVQGTVQGPTGLLSVLRAQTELAPDTRLRLDHLRTCAGGMLVEFAWLGTRDGGAFEIVFVGVYEIDALGRACGVDVWEPDVHHADAAWARFEDIRASAASSPLAAITRGNAATATVERWQIFDAGVEADWEILRASCAPGLVFEDRQGFARLSGDRELMIASLRERVASGARAEARLMGTAGERVAITRMLWSGGPADGRFEIEYVGVVEVDEAGLLTASILFGADDTRAAQREAWARWAAIDPTAAPWVRIVGTAADGFDAHDGKRLRALFADDVVVDDHRRTGFGRIDGADAYLQSLAVLWELAPDQRMEIGWFWPAVERHGVITVLRRAGTLADGGAFESECLWLSTASPGGRVTRLELFEIEDLDEAKARLEELRPVPQPPKA